MNIAAMVSQKCPKCEKGKMFNGVLKMHTTCTRCGFKFEREDGYFTSAIVIANFLYAFLVAPTILIMTAQDIPAWQIAALLGMVTLIAIPIILRFSRAAWLHFDFTLNPE